MMSKNKIFIFANMLIFSIFIMSCSSQEYTTAKLAIQQSDFSKASEWLPKAMEVEPDNPEIPMVMAIEIHAQNEDCLLYTSPSPRDRTRSRMPSSA